MSLALAVKSPIAPAATHLSLGAVVLTARARHSDHPRRAMRVAATVQATAPLGGRTPFDGEVGQR